MSAFSRCIGVVIASYFVHTSWKATCHRFWNNIESVNEIWWCFLKHLEFDGLLLDFRVM